MAEDWIASHGQLWEGGAEHVFCIALDGEAIGSISLRRRETGDYVLGYWLGEPWWGKGYVTEAARRIVRFAFEDLGVERLTAGHFLDNPASGRVLENCGFCYSGDGMEHSEARGAAGGHRNLECGRAEFENQVERP